MRSVLTGLLKYFISLFSHINSKIEKRLKLIFYYFNQIPFRDLYQEYPVMPEDIEGYLGAQHKEFTFCFLGCEGRPGFAANVGEEISLPLPFGWEEQKQIWLSAALREPLSPDLIEGSVIFKTTIRNSNGQEAYSGIFEVLLDGQNYLFAHRYGANWISWYVPLSEVAVNGAGGQGYTVTIQTKFDKTNLNKKAKGKSLPAKSLFVGFPQVVQAQEKPKKILSISCESLTDPNLVRKMFPQFAEYIDPYVFEFMKKYNAVHESYTPGDSTNPSCNSHLTGLMVLQHGMGSYTPNPKANNVPVRNNQILSAAQVLKRKGYLTFGAVLYTGLAPFYGCARGFDSYINAEGIGEARCPDLINSVIPSLEASKGANSYHYAHFDPLLHVPYGNSMSSVFSGIHNLKSLSEVEHRAMLYIEALNRLFAQLRILDDYVERNRATTDFLVQITGDHGHGLEPWWGSHKDYALYEQRIMVPYMVLDTSGKMRPVDKDKPVSAAAEMYIGALEFAGADLPDNVKDLPQFWPEVRGHYRMAETILHPGDDDYCIAIANKKFKYARTLKIDYDSRVVKGNGWEKLFEVKDHFAHEDNDVAFKHPEVVGEMRALTDKIVAANLSFGQKYPAKSSLDLELNWSVNDLRSPSAKNRRKKKVVKARAAKDLQI